MGVVFRFVCARRQAEAEVKNSEWGALNEVESRVENVLIEGSMRVMSLGDTGRFV